MQSLDCEFRLFTTWHASLCLYCLEALKEGSSSSSISTSALDTAVFGNFCAGLEQVASIPARQNGQSWNSTQQELQDCKHQHMVINH